MRSEAIICFQLLMAVLGTKADLGWPVIICLFRCRNCDSCSCALFPTRVLEQSVIGCGSWRPTSEWCLCHFDISGHHVGDLQIVEGDPFGPGANLEFKPFVSLCDDIIETCVGCLKGPLCFIPANVDLLSCFQRTGYVKPCCLCTMLAGLFGVKAFHLGSKGPILYLIFLSFS